MSVERKILQWLENQIFNGSISLGDDLPDDRSLSAIIKSSHSSTREALKSLETMGVLRLYEGKRKTIIPHLVSKPSASMAPALRLHMAQARFPIRDMIQTRIMIESWTVERADRSHPAMKELQSLADCMRRDGILPPEFHQLEVQFHIALTKLAGNHLMVGLMTSLSESMQNYLLSLMGRVPLWSVTATRLNTEHQAIIDAIQSGDNELARQLVVTNIEGQYAEAGIDIDEETRVANDMPGATVALEPVDIDTEDLVPDEWQEAVSPQLISALENISGIAEIAGVPSSADQTTEGEPQQVSEPEECREERLRLEEPEEAEQAEPFSQHREPKPCEEATAVSEHANQPPASVTSVTTGSTVLRAPTGGSRRRRRGTVSAPVHATVIKPIQRSHDSTVTGMIAGQLPAKSQRKLQALTEDGPGQTAHNTAGDGQKNKDLASGDDSDLGGSHPEEHHYRGGFIGKWLGFEKTQSSGGN